MRYLKCEAHGWYLTQRWNGEWSCKCCYYTVPDDAVASLLKRKTYWPGILVVDTADSQTRCITCGGPTSGISAYYCSDDTPGMYVPPPKGAT